MDVLVYSGPETNQVSLNHTLTSLKLILTPHYTVQSITQAALTTQPWKGSCALLVLPQCHDPFVSKATKVIKEFVEGGGELLMLGTSATATSRSAGLGSAASSLNFGLDGEVSSGLPLKFFDKVSNRNITFDRGETTDGSKPEYPVLKLLDGTIVSGIRNAAAASLTGFDVMKPTTILARYDGDDSIAGVTLDIGGGRIALWSSNVEYPSAEESTPGVSTTGDRQATKKPRLSLLKTTLQTLGLHIPHDEKNANFARPLPLFLTSTPNKPTVVGKILDLIAAPQSGSQLSVFKDANDEFHFHPIQESEGLIHAARTSELPSTDPSTWQPKNIIVARDGVLPDRTLTPLFDLKHFYESLSTFRKKEDLTTTTDTWGIGEALLYGEAVTSTQTMLDK